MEVPKSAVVLMVGLGILLNVTDLVVAFSLVLGGWNATNSHPLTGYITMAMAPVLLYLSSGMWTTQNWKLISRLVLYGGVFLVLAVSAAVFIIRRVRFIDDFLTYVLVTGFFILALLSDIHLNLKKGTLIRKEHMEQQG